MADELQKRFPLDTVINGYWLPIIRATIEINRGHPSKVIELLQAATPYELGLVPSNLGFGALLYPAYVRGQAYLLLREGSKAAAEFQKFLDGRSLVVNNPLLALAHLGLARGTLCKATPGRHVPPVRISLRFGKTLTPTFRSLSPPSPNMRS